MRHQRGQAMSEFLVSMVWVIPFVLMFVAIGNMIKVQTQTHKAARYVAWERTAYSGEEYEAKVSDPIFGFDDEIASRFFINDGSGFTEDSGGYSQRWQDWKSKQSIVNLDTGVKLLDVADTGNSNLSDAQSFLASDNSRVNWLSERSNVEMNTAVAATLQVDFSTENNFALSDFNGAVPHVAASYVLVADGWAPGNESTYSGRVSGLRDSIYSNAQRWYQNTAATRWLAPVFDEIGEKLFINDEDPASSFDMVSPSLSVAVPTSMLEAYEP